MANRRLDCVTIGYYEPRFDAYERIIRGLGKDSEAYRDLEFSFAETAGRRRGILTFGSFITGFPGETAASPRRASPSPGW